MAAIDQIKQIVVLMMENRSFDHILGFLKVENPAIRGVVGGDYFCPDSQGTKLPVTDGAAYQGQLKPDPGHFFNHVYFQMYGVPAGTEASEPTMSGFVQSYQQKGGKAAAIMRCFRPEQLPVISTLAREYAVCDQWFSSVPGPTLPNRAFAHFGTSFGRLDMSPEYFRAKPSIYQRLYEAGKKGRIYYYAPWSSTQGLTFLLSDQPKYFSLWGDFQADCKNDRLPEYSFVEPAYTHHGGMLATDQHPDNNVQAGDNFIKEVYDAIRSNDKVWNSTLLLILWDEHGGIFDHELPPMVSHPDGFTSTSPAFKFDRLGVRVPAVVVSPYIPAGTVDHTVYEHASIPAMATEKFIGDPHTNAPYKREQFANTVLHLLTLDEPRVDHPNFDAPPVSANLAAAASNAKSPASSMQLDLVQDAYAELQRNHPEVAANLDPQKVRTVEDAARFLDQAISTIHPAAREAEKEGRE